MALKPQKQQQELPHFARVLKVERVKLDDLSIASDSGWRELTQARVDEFVGLIKDHTQPLDRARPQLNLIC